MEKRISKRLKVLFAIVASIAILLIVVSTVFVQLAIGAKRNQKIDDSPTGKVVRQWFEQGKLWIGDPETEKLVLKTRDGLNLNGYLLPANRSSKTLVVLVHGYGSEAKRMWAFGHLYEQMGYRVFVADNRAHGSSQGDYVGLGALESQDCLEWISLLLKKLGNDTQILVHGVSMGATSAMMMLELSPPPQVKAIVEDCGVSTVYDELSFLLNDKYHLPAILLLPIANLEIRVLAGYDAGAISPLRAVAHSTLPILFIHGGADTYNPTAMVYALYDAAKGEKDLLVVPDAEHAMSINVDYAAYRKAISDFLDKQLRKKTPKVDK